MERLTEHVWWHPPAPPDRPALCAVVGERWTLMLDAGSSRRHTREALDGLPTRPRAVVYTHSHWDHTLGGVELDAVVIAHRITAERLQELAARDWSDEGLERRGAKHAEVVKIEHPSPRVIEVAQADVCFGDDGLDLALGGVTVHVRHVDSDHAPDCCVMLVEPDRVLFLGDCLSGSLDDRLTRARAFALYGTILAFDAEHHVEGHHPRVESRAEMEALIATARAAADGTVIAGDEDSEYFARAFGAGG